MGGSAGGNVRNMPNMMPGRRTMNRPQMRGGGMSDMMYRNPQPSGSAMGVPFQQGMGDGQGVQQGNMSLPPLNGGTPFGQSMPNVPTSGISDMMYRGAPMPPQTMPGIQGIGSKQGGVYQGNMTPPAMNSGVSFGQAMPNIPTSGISDMMYRTGGAAPQAGGITFNQMQPYGRPPIRYL